MEDNFNKIELTFIEDRIVEYRNNCDVDFRDRLNPSCRLLGEEILEIEQLSQESIWFKEGIMSKDLIDSFLVKLRALKTKKSIDELLELLMR